MRPEPFEYYAPSSLGEALDLLSTDGDAKILAGGQSLMTLMKLHLTAPPSLIDINRIPGLNYIREEAGWIAIGALTRHVQLASDPLIRRKCILLSEAANVIADQQVRNRGSIGGSIAHADPSADLPTACAALDAEFKAVSKNGTRTIAADDFFQDFFTTALSQSEILEEIRLPIPAPRSGGAYTKLTKGHNDFALVAVATQCSLNSGGSCESINVVVGGVASKPTHATETERSLLHRRVDGQLIHDAAMKADSGLDPTPDPRASSEMKRTILRAMGERTIRTAFARVREAMK